MPECVPCPACPAPPAPAGAPCPCRTCCCGKPPKVNPCYKQPKIPDSYAPRRCYVKPTAPVEGCTTYKLSYLPTCDSKNLRGVARKPAPNLVPSCEPMEGCTVQKLSFLPNPVCVTQPIRPCHHDMWGQGPMQAITTQRHDYVPKPSVLRESCKPPPKFHSVEQPFENRTVNKLSYLPPERVPLVKSFAPERCYEKPVAKMDGSTTQKMSYMPIPINPKEPLPWACRGQYQKPCQKLDSSTTYAMSYLNAESDCRRRAIIPDSCGNPVTSSKRFETQTIYKNSYLPAAAPIPSPVKPVPNLVPSTAMMEGDTVQKLSFLPNPVCVTQPIRPCHHDMWGQGPMQAITTQRHDYVPKPSAIRESCKPPPKFHSVESPFENRTVNRMSYINPGPAPPAASFAPVKCYEKPAAKMEGSTTHKLSYQPVCAPSPQRPPWACKGQYQKPCQKIDATTVYRSSFLPPGEDCSQVIDPCSYGDCKPCDCTCPAECIATDPCACAFPRAACCS
ncbi:stabilizer of axonemal microtubules 1 [Cydia pomonella]|uniref:stabilizer of axonemal microtubules 1 n=1 Tax=Cydia pomonella TaxID=82600 RepID=UPI002ADE5CCC|nr:stabilizer of axonemal microtubules 1 [Cydia pomonella]